MVSPKRKKMYAIRIMCLKFEKLGIYMFDIGKYLYVNGTINPAQ
jgi:hypothetical protein